MANEVLYKHWSSARAYEIPRDSKFADMVTNLAGCGGCVYVDIDEAQIWLTDGAGIVLATFVITLNEKRGQ